MSHYTVLIVGDNPEEQLEPFCEQTEDSKYLEFFDAEKKYREDYDSGKASRKEWHPADNIWLTPEELNILKTEGKISFKNHAPDRYFCSGRLSSSNDSVRENVVRVDVWDEVVGAKETEVYVTVSDYSSQYSSDIQKKLFEDFKKENPKEVEDAWGLIAARLAKEE